MFFDARIDPPRGVPKKGRKGSHVEIVFVPSADLAIRARLRDSDPARTAVVSHDREVCGYAHAAGARVIRVIDFLDELYDKGDRDIDPLEPREKYGL